MASHALFKAGAIVSSLAIAGGVIWYRTAGVNAGQSVAASNAPHAESVPGTETAGGPSKVPAEAKATLIPESVRDEAAIAERTKILMSGSKSLVITPTTENTKVVIPEGTMLMVGGKSAVVMPPTPATAPAMTIEERMLKRRLEILAKESAQSETTTKPATQPATVPATSPSK